jgi:hypothetical protein
MTGRATTMPSARPRYSGRAVAPRMVGRPGCLWATRCRPRLVLWLGPSWPSTSARAGLRMVSPRLAEGFEKIHSLFPFSLNSYLNFENTYLSVHSSKNYETGPARFVIL